MATAVTTRRHVFDVDPDFDVPDILEIGSGIAEVLERDGVELENTYYDTDDLCLSGSGVTVWRTRGPEGTAWRIRRFRHDRTQELTVTAPGDAIPAEVQDYTLGARQGRRLRRIGSLRVRRDECRALSGTGEFLAEVSDDRVAGGDVLGHPQGGPWREIVVAVPADDGALLENLDSRMRAAGARTAREPSKIARALAGDASDRDGAAHGLAAELPGLFADVVAADLDARITGDAVTPLSGALWRMHTVLGLCPDAVESSVGSDLMSLLEEAADALSRPAQVDDARHAVAALRSQDRAPVSAEVMTRVDDRLARGRDARAEEASCLLRHRRHLHLLSLLRAVSADPAVAAALPGLDELRDVIRDVAGRDAVRALERAAATQAESDVDLAWKAFRRLADLIELYTAGGGGRGVGPVAHVTRDVLPVLDRWRQSFVTRTLLLDIARAEPADGFELGVLFGWEVQRCVHDTGRLASVDAAH